MLPNVLLGCLHMCRRDEWIGLPNLVQAACGSSADRMNSIGTGIKGDTLHSAEVPGLFNFGTGVP